MDAVSDLLLLGLLLLLVTVPVATRAYQAGQEAGYTTGLEEGLAHKDAPGLEILDTFTSGRVYWRYGAGRTELSGYCDKTSYPAEALETVAAHMTLKEEQRHLEAADELVDDFLDTHGVFKNLE